MEWVPGRISLVSKTIGLVFIARKSSLESVRKARARGKQDAKGRGVVLLCDLGHVTFWDSTVTNLCFVIPLGVAYQISCICSSKITMMKK